MTQTFTLLRRLALCAWPITCWLSSEQHLRGALLARVPLKRKLFSQPSFTRLNSLPGHHPSRNQRWDLSSSKAAALLAARHLFGSPTAWSFTWPSSFPRSARCATSSPLDSGICYLQTPTTSSRPVSKNSWSKTTISYGYSSSTTVSPTQNKRNSPLGFLRSTSTRSSKWQMN